MFNTLLVCSLLVWSAYAFPNGSSPRIVGGKVAEDGQFPWAASLRGQWDWQNFCSGSIIDKYWILTAANCVYDKKPHHMHVTVGSVNLNPIVAKHDVVEIFTLEYHPNNFTNDVALLRLATPIQFNDVTKAITLSDKVVTGGMDVVFSGSGWVSAVADKTTHLQYLEAMTVGFAQCQDAHAPYPVFDDEQICVLASYKHGACDEDGGAALVHDGEQVGIFSWLRPCAIGIPDVFTRVSRFLPWIKQIMSTY